MQLTSKKIYSERVGAVIARGEADLGFQQVSELIPIAGIDFLGELPTEVQQTVLFSAGITSNRNNLNAARDLIAFLASKQVAPLIVQAGLKPILSPQEREDALLSLRYVDEVLHYNTELELDIILENSNATIRFLGDDYKNKQTSRPDLKMEIYYIDRSHGWSTTKFKNLIKNEFNLDIQ
jgi:glycerol-3-phosphate cytidylyltransferase-like family protein